MLGFSLSYSYNTRTIMPSQTLPQTLPVIDLRLLTNPSSPDDVTRFLADLKNALLNVGFFYVKNHGVSEDLQQKMIEEAKKFFKLPLEEKLKVDMANSPHFRGYSAMKYEITDHKVDNREQLDFGRELPAPVLTQSSPAYLNIQGPNQWPSPSLLPYFSQVTMDFQNALLRVADDLLRGMALSLDLPEDYFETNFGMRKSPYVRMKVIRYPALDDETDKPEKHGLGVGPHKDYGMLTVLMQDEIGGLQVQAQNGEWIDATPIPNTFVINIGEVFERLTQKSYLATVHRVLNDRYGRERFSVPIFLNPALDTIIPDNIPIPKHILDQRPQSVKSDVKDYQLLQYPVYGRSALGGLCRSHGNVFERWYKVNEADEYTMKTI